jgi:hypothetical protein
LSICIDETPRSARMTSAAASPSAAAPAAGPRRCGGARRTPRGRSRPRGEGLPCAQLERIDVESDQAPSGCTLSRRLSHDHATEGAVHATSPAQAKASRTSAT